MVYFGQYNFAYFFSYLLNTNSDTEIGQTSHTDQRRYHEVFIEDSPFTLLLLRFFCHTKNLNHTDAMLL